jgi:GDP-4-dehydro-6-deoxy-D-mannose reductase
MMDYLLAEHPDVEVFGIYRRRSRLDHLVHAQDRLHMVEPGVASIETLQHAFRRDKVNLVECDLMDPFSTHKLIAAVRPDRIFHLAAQSHVPASWNAPAATIQDNVIGQVNLFEALREVGIDPLVQIAGSSEEYGMVYPDEVPMKESNPLRPLSPYAVSKVTQEMLAYQYYQSYRIRSIVSRGFNHSGPRRGENFVDSSFARQIAQIERGKQEPVIYVGDLSSKRDFTDVRDMVRAYWLLLEKGKPGDVYNIGSGNTRPMQDVLDLLLSFSKVDVEVRVDPARLRPSDVMILWADASKFMDATGWKPRIPYEQTLRDLLDYWRERV